MADPTEVETTYWNGAQPGTIADANLFLLKEKRHCDVTFSFENLESEIEAHQLVLRARSRVFNSMLGGQGTSRRRKEIKISETNPARFQELLEFIYADKFEVVDVSVALQLLQLAHKYEIDPLIMECKQFLWTRLQADNALEVFQTAKKLGSLDDLKEKAANIMGRSLHILARNEKFLRGLEKGTLKYLLSQENLPISEVDLFNLALRWGRSHLQRNEATDHKALKRVLGEILPLVRYASMTAKEISSVVVPTKLLSPCQLVHVYSYLCGDATVRQRFSRKRNFNPVPRQRPHGVVVFIHEEGATVRRKNEEHTFPLTESLSFCVSELDTNGRANSPEEDRKLAITGIIVQWPARAVAPHTSENLALNFYMCLLRFDEDKVHKEAVDCMFRTVTRNCSPGHVVEVPVVPAMEISCPQSFCVVIKDELDQSGGVNPVTRYEYSWQVGPRKLKDSVCADFGNVMAELTDIQRNADICRLPDNVYGSVRTVRGIRIASI